MGLNLCPARGAMESYFFYTARTNNTHNAREISVLGVCCDYDRLASGLMCMS